MPDQSERFQYHFEVLTNQGSLVADMSFGNATDLDDFVGGFLSCFSEIELLRSSRKFEASQVKTGALVKRVEDFAETWRSRLVQLQRLPSLLRKLDDGEHFIVLPGATVDRMGRMGLFMHLHAKAENVPLEHIREPFMALVGALLSRYEVRSWGDVRELIGEPNREIRTCRFCGQGEPTVRFSKVAHAISEALGNKTLTLAEECDACNARFASEIEDDAIEFFAHYLTFHGVKGKEGNRTMAGLNYSAKHTEKTIEIKVSGEESVESTDKELVVTLEGGKPFALLNVYRALCKYFLSVVPRSELERFSRTIRWVVGDESIDHLPKVALRLNARFSIQPTIMMYRRLDKDKRTPYTVVEFQITSLTVVFVVPGSDVDDRTFADLNDFEHYWQTFQHYGDVSQWSFQDFSNPTRKEPRRVFKFLKPKGNPSGEGGEII